MKVAIIIVNFNNEDETTSYVEKIAKFNIINKIVVVDNMSTTIGAFEKLKKLEENIDKVSVIASDKNGGYSYGNNFGMKFLNTDEKEKNEKYDYIIVSNSDIDVEAKAVENTIKVLEENKDVAIAAPRMFYKNDVPARRSSWKRRTPFRDMVHSTRLTEILFLKVLKNGEYTSSDYEKEMLEVEAIAGSFFVIKNDIFEKVNYLDDKVFLFYEEDILGKKISDLGYKIISLNTEKFIHYESQTIGKVYNYFAKTRLLYKSRMYYQKTYNKIGIVSRLIFFLLYILRNIELLIEVPLRKLLKK